jgi:thiosulfate dehydrogenase
MSPAAARGKNLVHATYRYLGAESGIKSANGRPYVGNKLACSNCHMDDGTRPNAGPLIVVARKYVAPGIYSPREGVKRDLTIRINGCFERSLAGEALPPDSPWMQDLQAYMEFLASGIQPGYTWQQVPGQEFPKVDLLARAANPARGRAIYEDQCDSCHQDNGGGVWRDDEKRFRYPALWGPNSFGLMAGMGRLATAVTLVWGNMPYDKVDALRPWTRMSQEDAWDVTAYLLSKSRPFDSRFSENDWSGLDPNGMPNLLRRNPDASYDWTMPRVNAQGHPSIDRADPPRFTREQHKYGPFQPINDAMTQTRQWLGYP